MSCKAHRTQGLRQGKRPHSALFRHCAATLVLQDAVALVPVSTVRPTLSVACKAQAHTPLLTPNKYGEKQGTGKLSFYTEGQDSKVC